MRGARTASALAAAAAGTILAFPPIGSWPFCFVMLAPLVGVIDGASPRRAFVATWLYSVAMALVLVRWLLHALVDEYGVPAGSAWIFTTLLVGAYAALPASAVALYAALRPRVSAAAAPALFAALYVASEWLRAGPLGLPWILAGQPLAEAPLWLQVADLGGVHAVGVPVVLAGAGIGVAVATRRLAPLLLPLVVVLASAGYGALRLQPTPVSRAGLRVGIVQASVPQAERFQAGSALRNTRRHMALTRELVATHAPELVVWSETAVDDDLTTLPSLARELQRLVDETGVPLLTGAPRSVGKHHFNSVLLFTPGAPQPESYAKQILVPFSESDPPFAQVFSGLLGPVTEGEPYTAGTDATVLRRAPVDLATPVCFEITYPHAVRRFRAAGAELIVNLSNDAWFGRSGYAAMHLHHAVFRAIELRSWVVRGANTGISAVIDARGRVVARLPVFEEDVLVAEVAGTDPADPTLYAAYGDAPLLLGLVALGGGAVSAGATRRPRS